MRINTNVAAMAFAAASYATDKHAASTVTEPKPEFASHKQDKRELMAVAREAGWRGESYRKAERYLRRLNEAQRQRARSPERSPSDG